MLFPMSLPTTQYFSRFGQCEFLEIDEDELDTSNLHARFVRSPTKEILLSNHRRFSPSLSDANIDASTLLLDLGRLAPSVAKDFVQKEHAEASVPLRLLNDLDFQGEEDGYIAMSYCWKKATPDTPRRVITPLGALPFGWTTEVEQFPLPTSSAIFQAVLRERRVGEGLWFDQVCINQDDDAERTASLGAVDTIYKNARTVVIALDDIVIVPEEEQFLRYYVEQYSYSELPPYQQPNAGLSPPLMHQHPILLSFLERVLSSAWFERAWCSHEMRLGRTHVFILPCYTQYEDEVRTIVRFTGAFFLHLLVLAMEVTATLPTQHYKIRSLHEFFLDKATASTTHHMSMQRPDTPQSTLSERKPLVSMIAEIFRLQAGGNPRLPEYLRRLDANRDKMGIVLNASGLPLALTSTNAFSRPNIEDECLRSLLLVGLAARDPASLCTTGTPLRLHDGSISWLSRPTVLDVGANKPAPMRWPKSATQITQSSDGRAEFAQLDLIFLDLPHRTHANPQFPAHVARARTLVDTCIHYRLDGSTLWNHWQTPGHARALTMRNIFIQTLACIFDCGSQWLHDISLSTSTPGSTILDPHTIEMLLNPHLIIQNYILLPEGQAALSTLLILVSTLITSGIPWASGASERNYGPLIITAPTSSLQFDHAVAPHACGGKAIIFAPFEHSKTLLIAVPGAIKDAQYEHLARGWILTSMHPFTGSPKQTVSWTLQSKGVVFGDQTFKSVLEGSGEMDVRNHRVYGPSVIR
ncbi:heterokaryon incompatibility protein-domain-containing protein [Paraphoma chrysanthemicola]|uniref:Heterokaryon incompatibility protein-domain-containing protein n=1 Tax=Paraphoma chrysanthemicola TaxID=798071 RepID=A0A8K0W384_9PLEO|nr:heterokaryon incompatibility protein-domain-containing protein [Paraphoma chrysanthemicola]